MDLSRAPNDRKLYLCKWYFRAGFIFLPFVWAVNTIWFFKEAFRQPEYDEQKEIRKYVIYSAIGSVVWAVAIVAWVLTFQLNRADWGEFADSISFIIPLGRA
ncbi:Gamma-secretase subunit pen-2 [Pseudolycoriella hygida]|uniref:Gamma-secretase subunit PEN-2 n=1 Tax=Pseudolycoriella hygida TaxID=35572 RepID=A0A9Q0S1T8_9DIPT|nr:Gamma-secretase subunit pen-2 [Pseudolycoriella hygida]